MAKHGINPQFNYSSPPPPPPVNPGRESGKFNTKPVCALRGGESCKSNLTFNKRPQAENSTLQPKSAASFRQSRVFVRRVAAGTPRPGAPAALETAARFPGAKDAACKSAARFCRRVSKLPAVLGAFRAGRPVRPPRYHARCAFQNKLSFTGTGNQSPVIEKKYNL
ncbi:MAG: hypothetical protein Pg6A_08670 [Termitinemataceae bacterium]|nr:MAG: hypothetical protein Pg6A_08670 [Termitinemataceae bacterium]